MKFLTTVGPIGLFCQDLHEKYKLSISLYPSIYLSKPPSITLADHIIWIAFILNFAMALWY